MKKREQNNLKNSIQVSVVVSAISLSPNPQSNPTRCPKGPVILVAPELLFNLWEVFLFSPQRFGQWPGTAGRL